MHIWNSINGDGLGGNGDPERGFCVENGPFKEGVFKTASFDSPDEIMDVTKLMAGNNKTHMISNKNHCVRRQFNKRPQTIHDVHRALSLGPEMFKDFDLHVRINYHNGMHNKICK